MWFGSPVLQPASPWATPTGDVIGLDVIPVRAARVNFPVARWIQRPALFKWIDDGTDRIDQHSDELLPVHRPCLFC